MLLVGIHFGRQIVLYNMAYGIPEIKQGQLKSFTVLFSNGSNFI